MGDRDKLAKIFKIQKEFNDNFYDIESLSLQEKEEITKSLSLACHAEISDLVSGLNYKEHEARRKDVQLDKILYESVDIVRYVVAILNLWGFDSKSFESAFFDKDLYLNDNLRRSETTWQNSPVVIVDLDDIAIKFREGFVSWLNERFNIHANVDSKEYYTTHEVQDAGYNPEWVFSEFIRTRGLRRLLPDIRMIETISSLKSQGYWVQLLTARPKEELICLYDTYWWVKNFGLEYDRLDFSGEKYRWCTQSEYFDKNKIVCAIDDSPKHAAEYAKHGIPVFLPDQPYNKEVQNMENVHVFYEPCEILERIKLL
jgi:hypothetical protein